MTDKEITSILLNKNIRLKIAAADLIIGILISAFKKYHDIDKFAFDDSYILIYDEIDKNINPGILVALTTPYVDKFLNCELGISAATELAELLPSKIYHPLSVNSINATISEYTLDLIEESLNDFNKFQYIPNKRIIYKEYRNELVKLLIESNTKLHVLNIINTQYNIFVKNFTKRHEQMKALKKEPTIYTTDISRFLPSSEFKKDILNNEPLISINEIELTSYSYCYSSDIEDVLNVIIDMANKCNPLVIDLTRNMDLNILLNLVTNLLNSIKFKTESFLIKPISPDGTNNTMEELFKLKTILIITVACETLATDIKIKNTLSKIKFVIRANLANAIKAFNSLLNSDLMWIHLTKKENAENNTEYEYNINTNSLIIKKLSNVNIKAIVHALYTTGKNFLNGICVITYSKLMRDAEELEKIYKINYDAYCKKLDDDYKKINHKNITNTIWYYCKDVVTACNQTNTNFHQLVNIPETNTADEYIKSVNQALINLNVLTSSDLELLTKIPSNKAFINAALSLFN